MKPILDMIVNYFWPVAWLLVRCAITFACALTLHHIIREEGYSIPLSELIVAAISTVILIKIWAPRE